MEKSYKENLDQRYVLFKGEAFAVTSYPVQILINHLLEGILPCAVNMMDQEMVWCCDYTGKISLMDYCKKHNLTEDILRWIGTGLIHNIQEAEEYLLEGNGILLNPEDIYLDIEERKVLNCYIPFGNSDIWYGLQNLSRFFLSHLEQKDSEAIRLGYQLFHCMSQDCVGVEEIWKVLADESKRTDIEMQKPQEERAVIETVDSGCDKKEMDDVKTKWSFGRLIMCAVPFVISLFLAVFLLWNEWYLPMLAKMVLAGAVGASGAIGIVLVGKWKRHLIKDNPIEVPKEDIPLEKNIEIEENGQEYFEQTGEIHFEECEMVWGKLIEQETGKELLLLDNPSIIGKLPEVAHVRLESPFVSRVHAKLSIEEGQVYIEDLASKNGTYINGTRIEPQKPIRINPQDELAFANMSYYFQL